MEAEYKRDMNQNYLVVKAQEVDTSAYQVRMLLAGGVPYLLPAHLVNVDETQYFHYTVTSRQPMEKVYEEKLFTYDDLFLLFGGFIHVMESMSEYLMSASHLVLEPEYIFVDPQHKSLSFVYLPGREEEIRGQFQRLTEYVLPKLDHKDSRAVMLGYGVYRRALEDTFHLEHVKEELYRYRQELTFCEEEGESGHSYRPLQRQQEEKACAPVLADPWEELELEKEEEVDEDEGFPLRKVALISGAVVTLLLILAAKLLGYLPGISMESLLAGITLVTALGVLAYYLLEKRSKNRGRGKREQEGERKKREGEKEKRKRRMGKSRKGIMQESPFEENPFEENPFEENPFEENPFEKSPLKEPVSGRGCKAGELQTRHPNRFGRAEAGVEESPFGQGLEPVRRSYPEIQRSGEARGPFPCGRKRIRLEAEEPSLPPGLQDGEDYGETVALTSFQEKKKASLVSREPGELPTIYLNGDLTVVGKLSTAVDAVIEQPTVSRVHARIRLRDGEYYLTDLNSRNGTTVNGRLLEAQEEWKLQDQDEVDFAKARYLFLRGA